MIIAFFESVKHVGHLFPFVILRIFLGIQFLNTAFSNLENSFLSQPILAEMIRDGASTSSAPLWYKDLLDQFVLPQWQMAAYVIVYLQFVIGFSFILGFFVRPVSIFAFLLAWNYLYWSPVDLSALYKLQMICFLVLFLLGAGRCLGLDYYFYKRNRGVWW